MTSKEKATIKYQCGNEMCVLEDVDLIEDKKTGEKYFTLEAILQAEQRMLAKKLGISVYNIYELLLLSLPTASRANGIKGKFSFNKIVFYLGKRLGEEYGEGTYTFDKMNETTSGPIPRHLGGDIKNLQENGFVDVYIDCNNKHIHQGNENWKELMKQGKGSCVVILTRKGKVLARQLKKVLDPDVARIALKVKEELIFLTAEELKEKVRDDYPELRENYTENDTEDWNLFISSV
jgi:hypothetical protein